MTDLRTLHDAFTELERRADAAVPAALPLPRRARGFRLVPMVATMAAVAALAAGAVWLVPNDTAGSRVADQSTDGSTNIPTANEEANPPTPEALAAQFKAVLGDTATFEVMKGLEAATGGAVISGTLTAGGVTGGFTLAVYGSTTEVTCDPPTCTTVPRPGGSGVVALRQTPTGANSITYAAHYRFDDGTLVRLLVSNARTPDDTTSEVLASQPPLTVDQVVSIVSSDGW